MIGFVQGKIIYSDGKKAIVLTSHGVGYEINYGYFVKIHSDVELFIHHHISENDQSLWGFNTLEDKKMFELLKTVNKVGSSKAYPLVSTIGIKGLVDAILFEQADVLSKAPGIGKKMAEQIILSLKDKIDKQGFLTEGHIQGFNISEERDVKQIDPAKKIDSRLLQETIMALESLGYKDKDIVKLVQKKMDENITNSEELLKKVLREL